MKESFIVLLSWFVFILVIIGIRRLYKHVFEEHKWWVWLILALDIILVRAVLFFFRWPVFLHETAIFSPFVYASSDLVPSLGDLIFHITSLALFLWFIVSNKYKVEKTYSRKQKTALTISLLLLIGLSVYFWYYCLDSLICNSSISLDISNVFNLNDKALFVFLAILLNSFVIALLCLISYQKLAPFYNWKPLKYRFFIPLFFLFIVLSSLGSSVLLYRFVTQKEHAQRILLAEQVVSINHPDLGYRLHDLHEQLLNDSVLEQLLSVSNYDESYIKNYIDQKYLYKLSDDFFMEITICGLEDKLIVDEYETVVDCYAFFDEKKQSSMPSNFSDLYIIQHSIEHYSYLLEVSELFDGGLFIECFPTALDARINRGIAQYNYSFAHYENNELVRQTGNHFYSLVLKHTTDLDEPFFDYFDGYEHLRYPVKDGEVLVSKKQDSLMGRLSIFSFFFLFNFFVSILFIFIAGTPVKNLLKSFVNRLQLVILSIVIVAFFVTGVSSIFYVENLNRQKNIEFLREKTHSLLLAMENDFGHENSKTIEQNEYLVPRLKELSEVYFTDIHYFAPSGSLTASSRIDFFTDNQLNRKISPEVYRLLREEHENFLIVNEDYQRLTYVSSYVPFRNFNNELLGYLNMPHSTKQSELRREISVFMTSFVNLYVLFIMIAFVLVYWISLKLTNPIRLIGQSMQQIRLSHKNQKIYLSRKDELGQLVNEYNRMIDELASSAKTLAESERQTAWSEMAKQIAHEIKNPLTPMKLSVQQITRAWNDKKDDFEERFKRFSNLMIEQIDSLSIIASEFSDFAKINQIKSDKVNLQEVIRNAVALMNRNNVITYTESEQSVCVWANEHQLSRALINILKNAIQATIHQDDAAIFVDLFFKDEKVMIVIKDNGPGIPDEIKNKVFEPNFTTKTSGMGLGLAITRSMIESMGGRIYFKTSDQGTTFFIELLSC